MQAKTRSVADELPPALLSRSEAKKLGLKRYFTGKACPHGHVSERLTSNAGCYKCHRQRQDAKDKANPQRSRDKQKRWRANNLEYAKAEAVRRMTLWQKANPEKAKEHSRKWASSHKETKNCTTRRHRARRRAAEGNHTAEDVKQLYKHQGGVCNNKKCGVSLKAGYHVDHKTPLSRKGSNWPSNLQLLCGHCNDSKGAKTDGEWRATL